MWWCSASAVNRACSSARPTHRRPPRPRPRAVPGLTGRQQDVLDLAARTRPMPRAPNTSYRPSAPSTTTSRPSCAGWACTIAAWRGPRSSMRQRLCDRAITAVPERYSRTSIRKFAARPGSGPTGAEERREGRFGVTRTANRRGEADANWTQQNRGCRGASAVSRVIAMSHWRRCLSPGAQHLPFRRRYGPPAASWRLWPPRGPPRRWRRPAGPSGPHAARRPSRPSRRTAGSAAAGCPRRRCAR